jgi:hypothetical protein
MIFNRQPRGTKQLPVFHMFVEKLLSVDLSRMSVINVVDIRGISESHVGIPAIPFRLLCLSLQYWTSVFIPCCCHQLSWILIHSGMCPHCCGPAAVTLWAQINVLKLSLKAVSFVLIASVKPRYYSSGNIFFPPCNTRILHLTDVSFISCSNKYIRCRNV